MNLCHLILKPCFTVSAEWAECEMICPHRCTLRDSHSNEHETSSLLLKALYSSTKKKRVWTNLQYFSFRHVSPESSEINDSFLCLVFMSVLSQFRWEILEHLSLTDIIDWSWVELPELRPRSTRHGPVLHVLLSIGACLMDLTQFSHNRIQNYVWTLMDKLTSSEFTGDTSVDADAECYKQYFLIFIYLQFK